ncbi:MAG: hypothetical protein J6R52_00225 [Alphaproteobacteria bacterium]|nr:hypothetical protein [Alphaproteobacteria bacterium]
MNKQTKQEAKELFHILIAVIISAGLVAQVHSCSHGSTLRDSKPTKKEKIVTKADSLKIQAFKGAQSKTR